MKAFKVSGAVAEIIHNDVRRNHQANRLAFTAAEEKSTRSPADAGNEITSN